MRTNFGTVHSYDSFYNITIHNNEEGFASVIFFTVNEVKVPMKWRPTRKLQSNFNT